MINLTLSIPATYVVVCSSKADIFYAPLYPYSSLYLKRNSLFWLLLESLANFFKKG